MTPGHIRYAAVVWMLLPGKEPPTTSAVLNRIYFSLKRAGIPLSEISNLLEMMPEGQARGESTTPVDILRMTPIFRLLSDSEVSELGAGLRHLSFAPGELIIRQGDDGASMYFVTSGTVAITYQGADRAEHQVARMEAGDFFGEMSLLTGEVRGANAVALTRVDCYKLDKSGLEGIISRRADLAEDMSVVMAHREMELSAVRERLDLETSRLKEARKSDAVAQEHPPVFRDQIIGQGVTTTPRPARSLSIRRDPCIDFRCMPPVELPFEPGARRNLLQPHARRIK